jgi:hypothetical protein
VTLISIHHIYCNTRTIQYIHCTVLYTINCKLLYSPSLIELSVDTVTSGINVLYSNVRTVQYSTVCTAFYTVQYFLSLFAIWCLVCWSLVSHRYCTYWCTVVSATVLCCPFDCVIKITVIFQILVFAALPLYVIF